MLAAHSCLNIIERLPNLLVFQWREGPLDHGLLSPAESVSLPHLTKDPQPGLRVLQLDSVTLHDEIVLPPSLQLLCLCQWGCLCIVATTLRSSWSTQSC